MSSAGWAGMDLLEGTCSFLEENRGITSHEKLWNVYSIQFTQMIKTDSLSKGCMYSRCFQSICILPSSFSDKTLTLVCMLVWDVLWYSTNMYINEHVYPGFVPWFLIAIHLMTHFVLDMKRDSLLPVKTMKQMHASFYMGHTLALFKFAHGYLHVHLINKWCNNRYCICKQIFNYQDLRP